MHLAVGDPKKINELTKVNQNQYLRNPQFFNSYSYSGNNPIRYSDPSGLWYKEVVSGQQSLSNFQSEVGQATQYMTNNNAAWNYAVSNPIKAGLAVGVTGAAASAPAVAALAGITSIQSGVGAAYVGKMVVGSTLYGYITKNTLDSLPGMVTSYSRFSTKNVSTWKAPAISTGSMYVPDALGENVGALYNMVDSLKNLVRDLSSKQRKEEKSNKK